MAILLQAGCRFC